MRNDDIRIYHDPSNPEEEGDEYHTNISDEDYQDDFYRSIEHNQRVSCGAILAGTRIRKGQLSKDSDLDLCLKKDQIAQCIIEE